MRRILIINILLTTLLIGVASGSSHKLSSQLVNKIQNLKASDFNGFVANNDAKLSSEVTKSAIIDYIKNLDIMKGLDVGIIDRLKTDDIALTPTKTIGKLKITISNHGHNKTIILNGFLDTLTQMEIFMLLETLVQQLKPSKVGDLKSAYKQQVKLSN